MTGIAHNPSMRLAYKAYVATAITPNTELVPASDPGASGAQILRRVSSSLNPTRKNFKSAEIRPEKTQFDARLGMVSIGGSIVGELSPKTYQDLMAAHMRASWVAGNSKSQSQLTSLAAAAAGPSFTIGGGTSFATQGFMTGDVVRPANFDATNTGKNFILQSGLSGLAATVYPAPADAGADTSITLAVPGRKLIWPTSPAEKLLAFEHWYADSSQSHLFTECKVNTMKVTANAGAIPTIEFGIIGRDIVPATSAFFTSPTVITTSTLLGTYGGVLLAGGSVVGVISSFDFTSDLQGSNSEVAFQTFAADIFTGVAQVSGNLQFWLQDNTFLGNFLNETEFELIAQLPTGTSRSADFLSFFFPRIKLTGHNANNTGQGGIQVAASFMANAKAAGVTGYDPGPFTIIDSLSA